MVPLTVSTTKASPFLDATEIVTDAAKIAGHAYVTPLRAAPCHSSMSQGRAHGFLPSVHSALSPFHAEGAMPVMKKTLKKKPFAMRRAMKKVGVMSTFSAHSLRATVHLEKDHMGTGFGIGLGNEGGWMGNWIGSIIPSPRQVRRFLFLRKAPPKGLPSGKGGRRFENRKSRPLETLQILLGAVLSKFNFRARPKGGCTRDP